MSILAGVIGVAVGVIFIIIYIIIMIIICRRGRLARAAAQKNLDNDENRTEVVMTSL